MDEDGLVILNKARIVAQSFIPLEGLDYDKTFSPTTRLEAIRLFLAYASYINFKVFQIDVKNSFHLGDLQQEVFLKQPPVFENEDFLDHVYHLDKSRLWTEASY